MIPMDTYDKKSIAVCSLCIILTMMLILPPALRSSDLEPSSRKEIVYRMYAEYQKEFPGVSDVQPQKAMALAETGDLILVDVREDKEMAVSMVPGAVKKDHFLRHIETYQNKEVAAYCTIGYRSGKFAEEMQKKGIKVYNLYGR